MIPNPSTRRLNQTQRSKTDTCLPSIISRTASTKTRDRPRQGTLVPRMKNATVNYSTKTDKAVIRSVILANLQQCLEDIA